MRDYVAGTATGCDVIIVGLLTYCGICTLLSKRAMAELCDLATRWLRMKTWENAGPCVQWTSILIRIKSCKTVRRAKRDLPKVNRPLRRSHYESGLNSLPHTQVLLFVHDVRTFEMAPKCVASHNHGLLLLSYLLSLLCHGSIAFHRNK